MRAESHLVMDGVTANGQSKAVDVNQCFSASLQAVGTGTLTGNIKLQYSNDPQGIDAKAPVNWTDIPSATIALTAAGKVGIAKIDVCYNWIRADFSGNAGAGTVSVRIKTNGY